MGKRAIVYIEGYNLYYGIKEAYGGRYKWLDLQALAESFLQKGMVLSQVKYFTAVPKVPSDAKRRQAIYLKALEASCSKIAIYKGRFLAKDRTCKFCNRTDIRYEEKRTDVSIACEILNDAYLDRYDCCFIVSGDSDLVPPLESIKQDHLCKHSIVAHPPKRKSDALCHAADSWFAISQRKIRQSQLPAIVDVPGKKPLSQPDEWMRC